MQLAICTDVFAGLSYPDMLDKVKSLGLDAVEMTAGGWGARKHVNTAELLADEGKRKAFLAELESRGMRISALNTSCNPTWPSETGREYAKSMYDCAALAGLLGVKKLVAMAGLPAGAPDHFHGFLAGLHGARLRVPVGSHDCVLEGVCPALQKMRRRANRH